MKCKDCKEFACIKRSGNSDCFFEKMCDYAEIEEEKAYWQSFRAEATKDILCAVLPSLQIINGDLKESVSNAISNSIDVADELIKQLKEKEEK